MGEVNHVGKRELSAVWPRAAGPGRQEESFSFGASVITPTPSTADSGASWSSNAPPGVTQ